MERHNLFVVHSWDEAHTYARMAELLAARDAGLANYSVPPWKAISGPANDVLSAIDHRIQTASAVVVLNTPGLHLRPVSTHEMRRSVEMNKRIVVLQPHGAFNQPIPQVLDGRFYRVSPWRSDVLGRAVRGEYPDDERTFDVAEVVERRRLVGGIAALVGAGSFVLCGVTVHRLQQLSAELAAVGIRLEWTGNEFAQVAIPAVGGAAVAGLVTAAITEDMTNAAMAALAGGALGAAYGLSRVYRARLCGTQDLRVLTLERS